MYKLLFVTNMENHRSGMLEAWNLVKDQLPEVTMDILQIDSQEQWSTSWARRQQQAAFVLFTWMGTGLDCDFLKASSKQLLERQIPHLFNTVAVNDEVLDFGLTPEAKARLQKYFSCGGLDNFCNLCLWLAATFSAQPVVWKEPLELPLDGIYYPDRKECYRSLAEYKEKHIDPDKPTVGFMFYRDDWLWHRVDYIDAMIKAMEKQGCNIMAVFTSAQGGIQNGVSPLGRSMHSYFFEANSQRAFIDVLINPFVFGMTVVGFAQLSDFQKLNVPILQVYNLYKNKAWWLNNMIGLTPNEVGYAVAMPEFDGVLHSVPTSTNEEREEGTHYRLALAERLAMLARKAKKWANLRHKANEAKKIAIVFHNFPPTNSNIGSAAHLDSIESVRLLLGWLQERGYRVEALPENSQAFIEEITRHATNDRRFLSEALIEHADGKLTKADYQAFFDQLPEPTRQQLLRDWEEAPGQVFRYGDILLVPGMLNGNIFITVQPPRGFGDDPGKIYHSPDCAPTHHYLGFYEWLRDVWGADAMLHIGTHGSLEWLPGKGNAMNNTCYPDICTGDMPNLYPYWITCVGEGIQAKRRSAACLISYLSAPMSVAGSYDEYNDLEQLLEEYCHFKQDDMVNLDNLERLKELIRQQVLHCNLQEEIPESEAKDFEDYIGKLHVFITDLKNMQISVGLHVLGLPPQGDQLVEYMVALTKLDNGKVPSLMKQLTKRYGYDYYYLMEHSGEMLSDGSMTNGMLLDKVYKEASDLLALLQTNNYQKEAISQVWQLPFLLSLKTEEKSELEKVLTYVCEHIAPSLTLTTLEKTNLLRGLEGEYVDPSPSGAPTSGGADILPTGRNFYSIDPRNLPTKPAWEIGRQMAENVINRFIQEEGHYPESVGIILWATSNMRNHGTCIAEFLYLMGVKPVWQPGSGRVIDLELIPLEELKRPRVDVTGRISGLFRDSLPGSVQWLDDAVQLVAKLDEPLEMNFVKKHVLEELGELQAEGMDEASAWRQASFRIFGDPPGAHGAGVNAVLEAKNWETVADLAAVYTRWGGHAYGTDAQGTYMPERFKKRMSQIEVTVQNVDHRESSMLAGDDYNSYRGGLVAAVRSYSGKMPQNYVNDSSDRSKVQLRTLDQELKRWFRGEAMNPKYIQGMQKHGYKGAGDLATYVAVSFQWDATSLIMEDWMYEKYAEKYALDPQMQAWMKEVNPWALERITEVLLEAQQRGMWNAKPETLNALQELFIAMEGELEERGDIE